MSTDPEPKKPQENMVTILGLGGSGGQILHHIFRQTDEYNLLYADCDEENILDSKVKAIRIGDCNGSNIEKLINEVKDSEKIFVVSGLGCGFGTFTIPVIIYIAEELELDIELILSYPASFEGNRRRCNADLIIDLLKEFNIEATIFEFDKLIGMLKQKTSVEDMFKIMNESVYQQIRRTLNDTQEY